MKGLQQRQTVALHLNAWTFRGVTEVICAECPQQNAAAGVLQNEKFLVIFVNVTHSNRKSGSGPSNSHTSLDVKAHNTHLKSTNMSAWQLQQSSVCSDYQLLMSSVNKIWRDHCCVTNAICEAAVGIPSLNRCTALAHTQTCTQTPINLFGESCDFL